MARHITLKDVAQYAGVSVTTVSNVMRDWPYISDETRAKVQQAIDTLGYSPHVVAQGLRTGLTQAIAFVVPDLSNPYFAEMVAAAEDVAQQYDYTLLVFTSHEDHSRETASIRRATSRWADGLLITHTIGTPQLPKITLPMVAIDRVPTDYHGAVCTLDNVYAGELATEHLVQLGHRRIAHIAGPAVVRLALDRITGYNRVLDRAGLTYRHIMHSSAGWDFEDGYRTMLNLLDVPTHERPSAVFASNDRIAIGALHAIYDRGWRVPEDFSLVGVDGIEVSGHLNPPLTTVRQPLDQLARTGVDMLMRLIREEALPQMSITLAPELIVRRSTARFVEVVS